MHKQEDIGNDKQQSTTSAQPDKPFSVRHVPEPKHLALYIPAVMLVPKGSFVLCLVVTLLDHCQANVGQPPELGGGSFPSCPPPSSQCEALLLPHLPYLHVPQTSAKLLRGPALCTKHCADNPCSACAYPIMTYKAVNFYSHFPL